MRSRRSARASSATNVWPGRSTTHATTRSCSTSSGTPTTAASATPASEPSSDSTRLAWIFSPPRTITSAMRPCSVRKPSPSTAPRSPVRSHGPRNTSAVAASFASSPACASGPPATPRPASPGAASAPSSTTMRCRTSLDRPADGVGAGDGVLGLEGVASDVTRSGRRVERPQLRPAGGQLLDPARAASARRRRPGIRHLAEGVVGARIEHHQARNARGAPIR